jgi:hypothetical protein
MSAYLKSFAIPTYSDPGSQNQTYRDVLRVGSCPACWWLRRLEDRAAMGWAITDGHRFVVAYGRGTLRGQDAILSRRCVVRIPPIRITTCWWSR